MSRDVAYWHPRAALECDSFSNAAEYPRVFVVPLPAAFNVAHLSECPAAQLRTKEAPQQRWQVPSHPLPLEDSLETRSRWQAANLRQPFGPLTSSNHSRYHMQSPPVEAADNEYALFYSEYDHEIFFHNMVLGYCRRVRRPEDADLFYVRELLLSPPIPLGPLSSSSLMPPAHNFTTNHKTPPTAPPARLRQPRPALHWSSPSVSLCRFPPIGASGWRATRTQAQRPRSGVY